MFHATPNIWGWSFTNSDSAQATNIGTAVTPTVSSGAPTTFTQVATGANIAYDVYWVIIGIFGGNTTGQIKNHALDIGVDPAGGSSYTAVISNILCGQTGAFGTNGGYWCAFPLSIRAGSSVGVRVRGSYTTAGTVRVLTTFFGRPSKPEICPVGSYSETLGFTAASTAGVSFTPGNGAEGAWAVIGSATRDLWWWQLGFTIANTTTTAAITHVDLAYGDATNKQIIFENLAIFQVGNAEISGYHCYQQLINAWAYVPAGTNLYVRGWCNLAPVTGYQAVAIGLGG